MAWSCFSQSEQDTLMPETLDGQNWQAALQKHAAQEYETRPLPPRAELSALEEYQCRIFGGTLIAWLRQHSHPLLMERQVLKQTLKVESDPVIVVISDKPGLTAAREILARASFPIFHLPQASFDAFLKEHPDDTFRWHVVFTSYFHQDADAHTLAKMNALAPLQPGEEFWLHREASTLAPLFERACDHLWKWDGEDLALVEEAFSSWIS